MEPIEDAYDPRHYLTYQACNHFREPMIPPPTEMAIRKRARARCELCGKPDWPTSEGVLERFDRLEKRWLERWRRPHSYTAQSIGIAHAPPTTYWAGGKGFPTSDLDRHHLRYVRPARYWGPGRDGRAFDNDIHGHEQPEDLLLVCRPCHERQPKAESGYVPFVVVSKKVKESVEFEALMKATTAWRG